MRGGVGVGGGGVGIGVELNFSFICFSIYLSGGISIKACLLYVQCYNILQFPSSFIHIFLLCDKNQLRE